ncbi:Uncharacterized protein Fot_23428 [Forsythia ovata]|uniref:Uncharacterized protein n=1 Tax=Forsythia ovata TaxID=205694 RepID=A0ABD1V0V4_9LAMI
MEQKAKVIYDWTVYVPFDRDYKPNLVKALKDKATHGKNRNKMNIFIRLINRKIDSTNYRDPNSWIDQLFLVADHLVADHIKAVILISIVQSNCIYKRNNPFV